MVCQQMELLQAAARVHGNIGRNYSASRRLFGALQAISYGLERLVVASAPFMNLREAS